MQIKRFEASEVREALRQVKKEFGPEAVILSIKHLTPRNGLKGLLKKKMVEVVAAVDPLPRDKVSSAQGSKARGAAMNGGRTEAHKEALKRGLFLYFESLLNGGVDENVTAELIKALKKSYVNISMEEEVKKALNKILQWNGVSTKRLRLQRGVQKRVAFWGPTGVGKTSTVAKLASAAAMSERYTTGIINMDTERIGASAQMDVFSQVAGIPVISVKDQRSFKEAISTFKDVDLLLIDTPGIGPKTEFLLGELMDIVGGLKGLESYLVASATIKTSDLLYYWEIFGPLSPQGLVVTKLDEATTLGNILTLAYVTKIPLLYFSAGQEVPGSLMPASVFTLVERVISSNGDRRLACLPPEELAFRRKRFELIMEDDLDLVEREAEDEIIQLKGSKPNFSYRM